MNDDIKKIREIVKNVHGWLGRGEGEFLYKAAKKCKGNGVILEIGSWKGRSTIWLGQGSKSGNGVKIYAVDPHTGSQEHNIMFGKVNTFDEFKKNIKLAGVDNIVIPIKSTSEEAFKKWGGKQIELLWIDGDHKYNSVILDYLLWGPLLIENGIIAFHDTLKGDVVKVVKKYLYKGDHFANVGFIGGTTYGRKVKKLNLIGKFRNIFIYMLRLFFIFFHELTVKLKIHN